jgi:hypothetical protein
MFKKDQKGFAVLEGLLIFVAVAIIAATGLYVIHAKNDADKNLSAANSSKIIAPSAKKKPSSSSSSKTSSSSPSPVSKPVVFKITKVYFAKAPVGNSVITKAGFSCDLKGRNYNSTAEAEITSTAAGTAKYHWEEFDRNKYYADDKNYSALKHPQETVTFNKAETKVVSQNITYPYPADQQPDDRGRLYGQLYLNVIIDSPNFIYANIGTGFKPDSSGNMKPADFVYGTYVGLCWG